MSDKTFELLVKQAETKDQFGRIYPLEELQRICDKLNNKMVFGELDPTSELMINVLKVSHSISGARIHDGKLYCTFKILDTPRGNLLAQLTDTAYIRPAMRLLAKVADNGTVTECDLVAVDFYTNKL